MANVAEVIECLPRLRFSPFLSEKGPAPNSCCQTSNLVKTRSHQGWTLASSPLGGQGPGLPSRASPFIHYLLCSQSKIPKCSCGWGPGRGSLPHGRDLLRGSCFDLPLACVARTPLLSTDVSAGKCCRSPGPCHLHSWPPPQPPVAPKEKLREPKSWEQNTKHMEERCCARVCHHLLKEGNLVFLFCFGLVLDCPLSCSSSSFKSAIFNSAAPLLPIALVFFLTITRESEFYLL